MAHNSYQQPGGEDIAFRSEVRMLRDAGHEVREYLEDNHHIDAMNRVRLAAETIWSKPSYEQLQVALREFRPQVAHFHNTFPLISPSAYYACAEAGVPVVQTLHNYRLLCPMASFVRNGQVCESCLGRAIPLPGVVNACYRGSMTATAATAAMLSTHRALGTWRRKVNVYIALTEFARRKFIQGGLPADRIAVKPNLVAGDIAPKTQAGDYALFVGRLSAEKGPQLLPSAWRNLRGQIPLRIVGNGPLFESISCEASDPLLPQIELVGRRSPDEVRLIMFGARFLVAPSICYENFPIAIAEAFACGLPVIASRIGSMAEIVQDGVTGLHFQPGNTGDLAAKVEWAWNHPEELARMGRAAREEYEAKYQPSRNYEMLMGIYRGAITSHVQSTIARAARSEAQEN